MFIEKPINILLSVYFVLGSYLLGCITWVYESYDLIKQTVEMEIFSVDNTF